MIAVVLVLVLAYCSLGIPKGCRRILESCPMGVSGEIGARRSP